jgi:AraC-like DNA-binding protein
MQVTLVDFIPLFGALLSLLFVMSMLLRTKKISSADYFLLIFLFVCFLSLLHKFLNHSGYLVHYIHLTRVNHLLGILRPPLFFLYVYFAIHPHPKRTSLQYLHFIPFVILLIYLFPYLTLPASIKFQIYNDEINSNVGRLPSWYSYWGLIYSIIYLAWSVFVFSKALLKKGFLKPPLKRWIGMFLSAHAAFLVGAIIMVTFKLGDNWDYLAFHFMTFFIIASCVIFMAGPGNQMTEVPRPKSSGSITDENKKIIFEKAIAFLREEKLFLNDRLRLKDLAEKTTVPEYLLSQIINDEAGISFTELVNQERVEEAKRKLADPAFAHLTIEAIGADSGFNTKASFYTAFKKQIGLTPKEFKLKLSR